MDQSIARLELASRGPTDCDPLLEFLQGNIGKPVAVSLAEVDRLDALRLQTLLVGHAHWRRDEVAFEVCDISNDCATDLALLGVEPGHFEMDTKP